MAQTLEERVADLENRVAKAEELLREKEAADVQAKLRGESPQSRPGVIGYTRPDFLERFTGIFANNPLADEVFQEIAAERERERAEANRLYEEDQANQ